MVVRPLLVAMLCATLLASSIAGAQPSEAELEQAREAYRAALALETAGDWAGALRRLREVGAVKLTPQVRFHIARCLEKLGLWTEAVGTYRLAVAEAEASRVEDVARESRAALEALEPSVPKLRIRRGAGAAGASISLDGVGLGETSLAGEILVDPGPHRVELHRDQRKVSTTVTLSAAEQKTIDVDFPTETPAPSRPARVEAAPTTEGSRAPAFVALGVGIAGLAVAGTFWGLRIDTVNDLEDGCRADGHCPRSLESTSDRGKTFTVVSVAGLAVGTVGLLTFGWLMLSAPRRSAPTATRKARAPLGLSARGVEGCF